MLGAEEDGFLPWCEIHETAGWYQGCKALILPDAHLYHADPMEFSHSCSVSPKWLGRALWAYCLTEE